MQKMKTSADDIKNATAQKGDYIREMFSSVGVIYLELRAWKQGQNAKCHLLITVANSLDSD